MQYTKKIRGLSQPHRFSTGSNMSFPYALISVLVVVTNYQCNLKQQTSVVMVIQASEECIWIVPRLWGWINPCEILILSWECTLSLELNFSCCWYLAGPGSPWPVAVDSNSICSYSKNLKSPSAFPLLDEEPSSGGWHPLKILNLIAFLKTCFQ